MPGDANLRISPISLRLVAARVGPIPNGGKLVVKSRKQTCDFCVDSINLFFHEANLFDVLADEKGNGIGSQQDPEGIACGVLNLLGFLNAMVTTVGGVYRLCQFVRINGKQFFRCRVFGEKL